MENTSLHLLHLYLKPEYRGKAIGRDIVASCERLARGEGRGPRLVRRQCQGLAGAAVLQGPGLPFPQALPRVMGGIERNELIFERML